MKAHGSVHKYGDNVDTDVIIPARYLNSSDPAELAKKCMVDIDEDFVNRVKVGDIITVRENKKDNTTLKINAEESAKRPTRLALRNASLLLTELDDSFLPGCTFFPSNDAGIYFQGRLPKGRFTVFLNDDKMAYVVKGESGKLTASVNINRETVKYLNIGLKEYV